MSKYLYSIIIILTSFFLSACGSDAESEGNPLLGKYYVGSVDFHAYVINFRDDSTVQIVDCGLARDNDKRTSYYGSYSVDKSALTIKISDSTYSAAILSGGDSITFSRNAFDSVLETELAEATLSEFQK